MGTDPFARRPAAAAALATVALSLLSLGGWRAGVWQLTTLASDRLPMAPSTAATFLIFGVALLGRAVWPSSRVVFSLGRILTAGAVVMDILVAWLSRTGAPSPLDNWFPGVGTEVGGVPVGLMSWLTVATFIVTLIAFLTLDTSATSRPAARWSSLASSFAGALMGLVVLLGYASGTPVLYGGDAVPMAFLTAITFVTLNVGLFISGPVDRFIALWRPQEAADPYGAAVFRRRLVVAAAAVGLVIALSGFFFTRRDQTEARRTEHDQLGSVANLKAAHIAAWRQERLNEARFLMSTPAVVRDVVALVSRPGDGEVRARVSAWLTTIKGGDRYASVRVLDARKATLLTVPEGVDPGAGVPGSVEDAFSSLDIVFTDFHRNPADAQSYIELVVPIRPLPERARATEAVVSRAPVAAIVLRLDPEQYLLPLVRSWPGRSRTAETMLLRREGTEVVFLTNPKRGPQLAGERRLAADIGFTSVSMSDSVPGVVERADYRGIPVISALRTIPDSPWTLVAKVDQSEAYAPSQRQARTAGVLVLVLLATVGMAGVFVLRERHAASVRRALDAERQTRSHQAEILAGQARLSATLDAIPDPMFELGLDGRYYDYHSPSTDLLAAPVDALIGRTVSEILPPLAASAILGALREADSSGRSFGVQFELSLPVGQRWFELSVSRAQSVDGQAPRFIVLSRDITERKNAEEAIKVSLHEKEALLKEVHHRVKNNLQVITSLLRLETGRSGDEGTKLVLREMQGRIRSMALLHETLYRSGNFAQVDLAVYLRQLATQLFRGQNTDPGRVALRLDLATNVLAIDRAIPCGLIVNELLTNAIKYGFPDEGEGEVRIVLHGSPEGMIRLTVSDTGRGLPPDFEARRQASLGLQLVADLTRQLGGVLDIQPSPASFTMSFPAELPRHAAEGAR